jgi:hypothetical protein
MASKIKAGDRVSWNTSQGRTSGKVVKKLTSKTRIKAHTATASKDDPQYLVKTYRTGTRAVHKPGEQKKR